MTTSKCLHSPPGEERILSIHPPRNFLFFLERALFPAQLPCHVPRCIQALNVSAHSPPTYYRASLTIKVLVSGRDLLATRKIVFDLSERPLLGETLRI